MTQELEVSASLSRLAPALLKAQKALKNPEKNSVNPHFKNRYADLGASMDAALKTLNNNGIAVIQVFRPSDAGRLVEKLDKQGNVEVSDAVPAVLCLTTMLLHISGEFIRGTCSMPLDRANSQGYGSAATYARRYGVQAIIGMVAEDDDDGNASVGANKSDKKSSAPGHKSRLFGR